MDESEKRELAQYLLPHIMWDLRRVEIYEFKAPSEYESGIGNQIKVNEMEAAIRSKLNQINERGGFTVLIVPTIKNQKRLI